MLGRVSDAMRLRLLVEGHDRLQSRLLSLQSQLATGRRIVAAADDPVGAAAVLRASGALAALAQYDDSTGFGLSVLGAADGALADAGELLVRAEEIASALASGTHGPTARAAAAEEVHGLLQALTAIGNRTLAGRRLFGGLAEDAVAPFHDPDAAGYDPAAAYAGSPYEFQLRIGAEETMRLSTNGGAVFGEAIEALAALAAALRTPGGDVAATQAALAGGRERVSAERADVGVRQTRLLAHRSALAQDTIEETARRSGIEDADVVAVVTELAQVEQALQVLLAAYGRDRDAGLASLLRV
jgi:flagellar hook-associated protein 3 FlgL